MKEILHREGVHGLYRGYHVSLLTYAPNSALWWAFYAGFFKKAMESQIFPWAPIPLVQASCGVCSGLLAATLTNPLDVFRTRYQVQSIVLSIVCSSIHCLVLLQLETSHTLKGTLTNLWREEGLAFLKKGLSARIISTAPTSAILVVSYEWIKRMSLKTTATDYSVI